MLKARTFLTRMRKPGPMVELAGLAAIVGGMYEVAGRGPALFLAGGLLWLLAQGAS